MLCHLSPNWPLAVGGGIPTQKLTLTVCPTPIGLGETLQKLNVGICHAGVCALAVGTSIIEADIESIKNKAIEIVAILFLANFMYFYSPFIL
jgi:hypothetical protein